MTEIPEDMRTPEEVTNQLEDAIGRVIFVDYDVATPDQVPGRLPFLQQAASAVLEVLVDSVQGLGL